MRLDDELRVRVPLLLGYHLAKLGVVMSGLEALVPLLFRWITPHVNERVLGADAQLRIALLRDPIPHVRDPMPRVDGGRAAGKTRRERIPLPRLGGVHAQLEEPDGLLLLSVTPADSGHAERQAENRQNFPFQHTDSFSKSEIRDMSRRHPAC